MFACHVSLHPYCFFVGNFVERPGRTRTSRTSCHLAGVHADLATDETHLCFSRACGCRRVALACQTQMAPMPTRNQQGTSFCKTFPFGGALFHLGGRFLQKGVLQGKVSGKDWFRIAYHIPGKDIAQRICPRIEVMQFFVSTRKGFTTVPVYC